MIRAGRSVAGVSLMLVAVAACDCGDASLGGTGETALEILSPEDGASISSAHPVVFSAQAKNGAGLDSIELFAGETLIRTCTPEAGVEWQLCSINFNAADHGAEVVDRKLTLRAVARAARGPKLEKTIVVHARPPRISFNHPRMLGQQKPVLKGTSRLDVDVGSIVPVAGVQVTYTPLPVDEESEEKALFILESRPYARDVNWSRTLGLGEFRITARVFDEDGLTATAMVEVSIRCGEDAHCGDGTRCCVEDGFCHPTVGPGAECSCTSPCSVDQGCFPGACNEAPRRCRPGCFPGDHDTPADACDPIGGMPAYCAPLPVAERTAANGGGACVPGDGCDVIAQDCPDLPVDRSRPFDSVTNPLVPHNCIPTGPTATICVPTSGRVEGATGCADLCGAAGFERGCGKGLVCMQTVNEAGAAPVATCFRQCDTPNTFGQSTCLPATEPNTVGEYCVPLEGPGREPWPIGICR